MIWTGAYSNQFCEWSILTAIWIMKIQVKTSTKRISGSKNSEPTATAVSHSIDLNSRLLSCSQVMLKSRCFLRFNVCCRACFQRLGAWEQS